MTSNKNKFFPPFPAELLNNNWPFSFDLASELFHKNILKFYPSLRTFLIKTTITDAGKIFDVDDPDVESDDFQICLIDSEFRLKNNTVYYEKWSDVDYKDSEDAEDSLQKVDSESGKTLFLVEYNLDNISYQTIVCEAFRFYIKDFLKQPSSFSGQEVYDNIFCLYLTLYLLYTTYSHFLKNLIEEEKYMEIFQEQFLLNSYKILHGLKSKHLKSKKNPPFYSFFENHKGNPKERLLNLLCFTPLSKDESEKLVDNYLSTRDLQQIFSYYQEILKMKE